MRKNVLNYGTVPSSGKLKRAKRQIEQFEESKNRVEILIERFTELGYQVAFVDSKPKEFIRNLAENSQRGIILTNNVNAIPDSDHGKSASMVLIKDLGSEFDSGIIDSIAFSGYLDIGKDYKKGGEIISNVYKFGTYFFAVFVIGLTILRYINLKFNILYDFPSSTDCRTVFFVFLCLAGLVVGIYIIRAVFDILRKRS